MPYYAELPTNSLAVSTIHWASRIGDTSPNPPQPLVQSLLQCLNIATNLSVVSTGIEQKEYIDFPHFEVVDNGVILVRFQPVNIERGNSNVTTVLELELTQVFQVELVFGRGGAVSVK